MANQQIGIIFAMAKNGVIGNNGQTPWYLPEDLKFFKEMTMGDTVIMGRKTWDSIPDKFKPLVGRDNIILTKQQNFKLTDPKHNGVLVANSIEQAIAKADPEKHIWFIGGSEIYNLAMPLANYISITEIVIEPQGDTFAPNIDLDHWRIVTEQTRQKSTTDLEFQIKLYERK
jgi:dihydrofolate reductase